MTWTLCKHGGPSPAEKALAAELTAARSRIAALEDWQRRAVDWMHNDSVDCDCPVIGGCAWCRTRNDLVEEATR